MEVTRASLLILSLSLLCLPPANAQKAFGSSAIGLEINASRPDNTLSEYWQSRPGFTLTWTSPFYLGELELRAEWLSLSPLQDDLPSVNNIMTTAGWYLPLAQGPSASLSIGATLGNNFMYRSAYGPLEGPESEFTTGVNALFHYALSKTFSLRFSIRQTRTYTWHRMNFTHLGFGMQYRFTNPPGLIQFLR